MSSLARRPRTPKHAWATYIDVILPASFVLSATSTMHRKKDGVGPVLTKSKSGCLTCKLRRIKVRRNFLGFNSNPHDPHIPVNIHLVYFTRKPDGRKSPLTMGSVMKRNLLVAHALAGSLLRRLATITPQRLGVRYKVNHSADPTRRTSNILINLSIPACRRVKAWNSARHPSARQALNAERWS